MKLGILGCGNWGSVFGIIQHKNGHQVKIWEYDKKRAVHIIETRNNEPFLVGYKIPEDILIDWNIENILKDVDVTIFALPSQVLKEVVNEIKKFETKSKCYLSLIKGIDIETTSRPSEIIEATLKIGIGIHVLSGPCIANEIIRGEPTAVVLVGSEQNATRELQHQLTTENFRIYQGNDMIGVELGGAIKNVLAIACGISDGLGFGTNTKGALITRGIVEMQRLGVKMGANPKTFWGLSGLGDLVTTSFSEESRNHRLGRMIGQGKNLNEIVKEMVMVAEGMPTAKAVKKLSQRHKIEMPICGIVYEILFENKSPKQGIKDLMERPLKYE